MTKSPSSSTWTLDPVEVAAATRNSWFTVMDRGGLAGLTGIVPYFGSPCPARLLVELIPDPASNEWVIYSWLLPAASKDASLDSLAAMTIQMSQEPVVDRVSSGNRIPGHIREFTDATIAWAFPKVADEVQVRAREITNELLHERTLAITERLLYSKIVEFVPELTLKKAIFHRAASGTWGGRRFAFNASGRKAYLRVWGTPEETARTQPSWEATIELAESRPFFQQLHGKDHVDDLVLALHLCAGQLKPLPGVKLPPPALDVALPERLQKALFLTRLFDGAK